MLERLLAGLTYFIFCVSLVLSALAITVVFPVDAIVTGLYLPILVSVLALFFTLVACRGKRWPLFVAYMATAMSFLHLMDSEISSIEVYLWVANFVLCLVEIFLLKAVIKIGQRYAKEQNKSA